MGAIDFVAIVAIIVIIAFAHIVESKPQAAGKQLILAQAIKEVVAPACSPISLV